MVDVETWRDAQLCGAFEIALADKGTVFEAPAMVVAALIATQTLWVVALSAVPIWATQ